MPLRRVQFSSLLLCTNFFSHPPLHDLLYLNRSAVLARSLVKNLSPITVSQAFLWCCRELNYPVNSREYTQFWKIQYKQERITPDISKFSNNCSNSSLGECDLKEFLNTLESRLFKPPRETKIGSKNRRVWDTGGKILLFDWGEGNEFSFELSGGSKKWRFEKLGFHFITRRENIELIDLYTMKHARIIYTAAQ